MAAVRGAVRSLPGFASIEIQQMTREFSVEYDASALDESQILAALAEANWPAQPAK